MSNEKTNGNDIDEGWPDRHRDVNGLPGYPSNSSVPTDFSLPLPQAGASDPWSSTWSDVDWDALGGEEAAAGTASWRPDDTSTIHLRFDDQPWTAGGSQPTGADDYAASAGEATSHDSSYQSPYEPSYEPAGAEPAVTTDGDSAAYTTRADDPGPHADELITARSKSQRQRVLAGSGLRRAFGLGPGRAERLEHERIDRIARPLNGRKTIMVINTKGGGGKTLVTLLLASYLGRYRSGSVLAWDNNETEGTLGMRAPSQSHHRTVVDLLGALPRIQFDPNAGTSELEHWVREQRGLNFDVLASADDDEAMRIIGKQEFEDLHTQLSRFYRTIVVDTGNNRLSPNWLAAAERADLLVFATSLKDDTSVVAAKNLDALVGMGRQDLVHNAVCVISHTSAKGDPSTGVHTREHFEQWVRAVVDIPYDPGLAPGLHLDLTKIDRRTDAACMEMAASVVDGL